jgi:hypothetical protein
MELRHVPRRRADAAGNMHRPASRSARSRRLHPERFTDRRRSKWFPLQLQRRARPRVRAGGKGRRPGLADDTQALTPFLFPFNAESTMHTCDPRRSPSARTRAGLRATLCAALAALAASTSAHADDSPGARVPALPKYQQECGACHLAYPPGMLPAASWQSLMAGLPRHFGTDASLDATTAHELSAWLDAHAGTYKKVREAPPQDRIACQLVRARHREVNTAVALGCRQPANCAACHTTSDQGASVSADPHTPVSEMNHPSNRSILVGPAGGCFTG